MNDTKICKTCGELKDISTFGKHNHSKDHLTYSCTACRVNLNRESQHRTGNAIPYDKAKDFSMYLGIHIAESLLSTVFDNVTRAKMNNPGYDFICGKGYKIDSKSACITHTQNYDVWGFHISQNKIADCFACIGFDNRRLLTPIHFWLIPGYIVQNKKMLTIKTEYKKIENPYSMYERPIEKIANQCNVMRGVVVDSN